MTPLHIAAAVADWKCRLKPNSVATYRAYLHMICRLADRLYGTRLQETVPRVPPPQTRTLTATEAEFNALLAIAKPWMRTFLLLTRSLGLRRAEALAIAPANLQQDDGTIYFRRKLDGESNIPLTTDLVQLFLAHAKNPNSPLLESIAGRPVSLPMVKVE